MQLSWSEAGIFSVLLAVAVVSSLWRVLRGGHGEPPDHLSRTRHGTTDSSAGFFGFTSGDGSGVGGDCGGFSGGSDGGGGFGGGGGDGGGGGSC